MPDKKFAALSFTVALALGGVVALLWLLSGSQVVLAQSGTGVIRVATTGSDAPGCGSQANPCQTVQYAVNQAQVGEEIRVASGHYTGFQTRTVPAVYPNPPASGLITQVVYISKTITIRGGYTTAFTDPPDPEANQTTLDAQGGGRVLFISGDISPTIEGLRITGGNAAGMGGVWGGSAGGGIYVNIATTVLSGNLVYSNTAYGGGGLWLLSSDATLSGNTVISNTADHAGGLCLYYGDATFSGNTVLSNRATGYGGGLYLYHGAATLSENTIISNTAGDHGGGLYLYYSGATLNGNTVISNTTDNSGGGLYLDFSDDATLSGNTIIANTAHRYGGGLSLWQSDATLSGNTVMSNTADGGGGLYLYASDATLSANTISDNTANATSWWNGGGGLFLESSAAALTNTVVANNQTGGVGSGLYIWASSSLCLLHTTIARNSEGDGIGIYVDYDSTVALTNTILVSHTVGITVRAGNTATLESTLWYSNTTADWGGAGTIVTGTHNYWGDPRFDADGYHLTSASTAAIDKGVDAGVTTDIDGDSRPQGSAPDLGADEFVSAPGNKLYLPLILKNY